MSTKTKATKPATKPVVNPALLSEYNATIVRLLAEAEAVGEERKIVGGQMYTEYCKARFAGIPRADCEAPFKDADGNWLANPLSDSNADFGKSIGKYGSTVDLAMKHNVRFVSKSGEVLPTSKLIKAVEEFRTGAGPAKKTAPGAQLPNGKPQVSAETRGTAQPATANGVRITDVKTGELATGAIDDVFKYLRSKAGAAARKAFATDILALAEMIRKESRNTATAKEVAKATKKADVPQAAAA